MALTGVREYDNSVFVAIGPYLIDFMMCIKIIVSSMVLVILYPFVTDWLLEITRKQPDIIVMGLEFDFSKAFRGYLREMNLKVGFHKSEIPLLYVLAFGFPFLINQLMALKMLFSEYILNSDVSNRTQRVVLFNNVIVGMILLGIPTILAMLFFIDHAWLKSIYLTWGIVPYVFFYYMYQPLSKVAGLFGFIISLSWFFEMGL